MAMCEKNEQALMHYSLDYNLLLWLPGIIVYDIK